jgi:hypothetical protein
MAEIVSETLSLLVLSQNSLEVDLRDRHEIRRQEISKVCAP